MLNNKFFKTTFYTLLLFMLISCDSFLSELPDNRTIVDSPEKVSALITGAYPNRNYMMFAELMSDNAEHKGNANGEVPLQEEMYSWKDSNLEDIDSPFDYWEGCYKAIAQANEALKAIEDLKQYDLRAQKGEALLARAYAHFMLVNFWGKHYNPTSSKSDLGIPYVLEPETALIKEYKRNTVEEVYNFIEKDLIEGLSLVKSNYDEPKFHFTKEAGYAFATRFYTFKGEWDNVIKHASKVFTTAVNEIRDDLSYIPLSYDETRQTYASQPENTNLLLASPFSLWARGFAGSRYGLTADKANQLFFSGAGNPFLKGWAYRVFGTDVVYNLPKFKEYFKFTNQSAGIGFPFVGIVLLDKDEVLLNRAEAYVMKGDYTNALKDLNDFLSKKTRNIAASDMLTEAMVQSQFPVVANEYTPYYTLTDKQTSFVKAIAEFKRREYYHEGLRWFDVKRFKLQVEHKVVDGASLLLTKEDNRKLLQIPNIAVSRGLTPNPR